MPSNIVLCTPSTELRCLPTGSGSRCSNPAIPFDPAQLISLIARAKPQFCNRDEQDAQELFEVIVDIVSEELRTWSQASQLLMVQSPGSGMNTANAGYNRVMQGGLLAAFCTRKEENDALRNHLKAKRAQWLPFHGLLASHVRCVGCGVARCISHQSFCSISLTIGQGQANHKAITKMASVTGGGASINVYDSLRRFVSEELLEEVECECCSADHLTKGLTSKIAELTSAASAKKKKLKQEMKREEEVTSTTVAGCAVGSLETEVVVELGRIAATSKFWRNSGLCSSSDYDSWDARVTEEIVSRYELESDSEDEADSISKNESDVVRFKVDRVAVNVAVIDVLDMLAGSVRQTTSKRLLLSRLPQCLCLHINRKIVDMFTGNLTKIDTFVRFPLMMDLSAYRCTTSGKYRPGPTNPNLYLLKAVVVHLGSADGGHYVTYAAVNAPLVIDRADTTAPVPSANRVQWVLFSDANTKLVSEAEVLAARAFLLFYEQHWT